ncbi:MAG: DUF1844 domain-containing protein [Candidatus Bathyarchaeia archaeon]
MSGERREEQAQAVELTALDLEQLLGFFVGILASKAWQYMGYRLAPGKEEAERDLVKAATAIDCVAFMVERLAPSLPDAEARRLRAMVTDLQINYAKLG